MKKKTYYVTVESGEILEQKAAEEAPQNSELAIEATPQEVERLRLLFEQVHARGFETFLDAHIPIKLYSEDRENVAYDAKLYEIYKAIYELGTPETKRFMEENRILEKLGDTR